MRLIEIHDYSSAYYIPKSKRGVINEKEYYQRLYSGPVLIDIDSIVTVEPVCTYDEETLETKINSYCIYFRGNETKIYTDIEGYNLIKQMRCVNNSCL